MGNSNKKIIKIGKNIIKFLVFNTLISAFILNLIAIVILIPGAKTLDISLIDIAFNNVSQEKLEELDAVLSERSEIMGRAAAKKVFKSLTFMFPESKNIIDVQPSNIDPLDELDHLLEDLKENKSKVILDLSDN